MFIFRYIDDCIYKKERNIKKIEIRIKGSGNDQSDEYDLSSLKMVELKGELSERGLKTSGNKKELIERLTMFIKQGFHEEGIVFEDKLCNT